MLIALRRCRFLYSLCLSSALLDFDTKKSEADFVEALLEGLQSWPLLERLLLADVKLQTPSINRIVEKLCELGSEKLEVLSLSGRSGFSLMALSQALKLLPNIRMLSLDYPLDAIQDSHWHRFGESLGQTPLCELFLSGMIVSSRSPVLHLIDALLTRPFAVRAQ